ncbi:XdhC family protein [Sulfurisphaera javensis]|uniref:XdhC family protein n=1 Tax=Sulfurisphaera javensis TaxID=2049879 RepID=A0AAT9GQF9_9CREN
MSICEIFPLITKLTAEGKKVVMVNEEGKRSIFVEDKLVLGFKEHERYAKEALEKGRIEVEINGKKIIAEVIEPRPSLIIVGSGIIAKALAKLSLAMGYLVAVIGDNDINEEEFAGVNFISNSLTLLDQIITEDSFVIIANEGGKPYDVNAAYIALKKAKYVGFLASQKRAAYTIAQLMKKGIDMETLKTKFYSPLGLDLNAKTAEEIALSALSEVVKILRGGSGKHMREIKDPYMYLNDALEGKIEEKCNFKPQTLSS